MNAIVEIDTASQEVVAVDRGSSVLDLILRAASDPSVAIEKMERLFALHERMQKEQARKEYNEAMARAQSAIGPVTRDRQNAHTKSAYATLEAIDDAIRPVCTANGFSLSFDAIDNAAGVTVVCQIMHSGGHTETRTLTGALDTAGSSGTRNKTDIQALGSTVSYLRRYLTCMVFNVAIANEDKDGNRTAQTISAAQYVELKDKLEAINGNVAAFLTTYRVDALEDLPALKFDNAVSRIEARAKQLAAEKSNAG